MRKRVMAEQMKYELANDLGFGDKVVDTGWSDMTTGEIGSMIREAIRRAENTLAEEARQNAR